MELDLKPLNITSSINNYRPIVISGPCSAETQEQVIETAKQLKNIGISIYRAGIWKPRTKPGGFEGIGKKGLPWLSQVHNELGMLTCVEVATPHHVEDALKNNIDILWIGARTAANPFAVQDIANSLKGVDIPILFKNPVNPDIELWIGGMQRLNVAGIQRIAAVHRGFTDYGEQIYRNSPMWQIAIELHRRIPKLPIFCDPSHIAGQRKLIPELCQQAMDMGFDGLMVESHYNPEKAWSDSMQQLTPEQLNAILKSLVIRSKTTGTELLKELRYKIDNLDDDIVKLLSKRMQISREIAVFKKEHNMTVFQAERYNGMLNRHIAQSESNKLSEKFIKTLFEAVHEESIQQQINLIKKSNN
ncbi:MAG: bifunctional 3-deoxy-7-phosphoheptulonate synthase/chorismate mutase type II [Prevotellaceae bacterium]|nr:bifunctional 3-deoxy-7-phosphoheptulonate synthase/chorismate mutase type II [Candidatus Faecinaster equi]